MKRVLLICITASAVYACLPAYAQSLGDVAREARAKKSEQHARHVYTDEDFSKRSAPSEVELAPKSAVTSNANDPATIQRREDAAAMQAEIRRQKQKVSALHARIKEIEKRLEERESIGPVTATPQLVIQGVKMGSLTPGTCDISKASSYDPYKDWCEEPAKLRAELGKRQPELEKASAVLEQMQEQARRMGFGSAFYDPD